MDVVFEDIISLLSSTSDVVSEAAEPEVALPAAFTGGLCDFSPPADGEVEAACLADGSVW